MKEERICPLAVAEKLADAHNRPASGFANALAKDPGLRELLWFIQWKSLQPGGLSAFSRTLIEEHPKELGPFAIVSREGLLPVHLDLPTWRDAYEQMPFCRRPALEFPDAEELVENELGEQWPRKELAAAGQFPLPREITHLGCELRRDPRLEIAQKDVQMVTAALPTAGFVLSARDAAGDQLQDVLYRLCVEPGFSLPEPESKRNPVWFMPRVIAVLRSVARTHAESQLARIAKTSVSTKVFDALDFGWARRGFISIEGDTRWGKSEACRAWATAFPGRARWFQVPSDDTDLKLFRGIANAFGLAYDFATTARWLADRVDHVVKVAGVMILADEAHFLLPSRYTRNTKPKRLNWFRTTLLGDPKVPCAIVVTPQAYRHDIDQFKRATGFSMNQWLGRTDFPVTLPELSEEDVKAVCDHYLPGLPESLADDLIGRAFNAPGFLKAFEDVSARAVYLANRDGSPLRSRYVSQAMEEILAAAVKPSAAAPVQRCRREPAEPPNRLSIPSPEKVRSEALALG